MRARHIAALAAASALVIAACGSDSDGGGTATTAGGAGGGCTVGVSWTNYQEERWAKWDEPAIKAAIEAAGLSSDVATNPYAQ